MFQFRERSFACALLAGASLLLGTAGPAPAWAEEETHVFDIRAQPLSSALLEYSRQSEIVVVVSPDLVAGKRTQGVKGALPPAAALQQLLAGTGLVAVKQPNGGVTLALSTASPTRLGDDSQASPSGETYGTEAQPEEIIVTAQKRKERLLDVPESVTAIQAEPLVSTGQVLLRDYYTQIPGFSVSPNTNADQVLSIRGISTAGYSNPTVGVLIDDAPYASRNSVPDIDPEDLARIEVLRGPQGTLYGANSMGGLINYVTADPSTSETFGRIEAGTSTTDNGAEPGYDLRGSINLPVDEDLAVRLSAFRRQDAGYIDNPTYNLRGANQTDAEGARLAVLWRPISDLTIRLSATYQNTQASYGTDVVPSLGQYKIDELPNAGAYHYRPQIYNVRLNYDFGDVMLTSVTSYTVNDYLAVTDFSSYYGSAASSFFNRNAGIEFDYTQSGMHRVTQEVRLASEVPQFIEWMIGAFYSDLYEPNIWHMDARDLATDAFIGRFWNYSSPQDTEEDAIFANAKVKLFDRFDVQFGARETRTRQAVIASVESGPAIDAFNLGPIVPGGSSTAYNFTYMASPAYHITPNVMAYVRVATGFRPVTPNVGGAVAEGAPATVNPDTTTNYEVGLKGDFLDHALSIEAAAYRIDWQNIQLQLQLPQSEGGFVYLGNGSGAISQGFELTVHARPTDSLFLDGWISYDDAHLTRGFAYGVTGEKLPFVPQVSAYVSAEQDFALSPSWTAYLGADLAYVGGRTGVFIGLGDPRQIYPSYTKLDLRVGARADLWRVELYATNVGNSPGELNGGLGYTPTPTGELPFIEIPPRTVGVSLERKF